MPRFGRQQAAIKSAAPVERVMELLFQIIGMALGTVGATCNVLLLAVLWRARRERFRLNMQLVGPLAAVDLSMSLLLVAQSLVSMVTSRAVLMQSAWFCRCLGVTHMLLPCTSIRLLSTIALDRYWIVVYERGVNPRLGWILIVLVTMGLLLLMFVSNFLYGFKVDATLAFCRPQGTALMEKIAHRAASCTILLGFIIVVCCYAGVYRRTSRAIVQTGVMRCSLILAAYILCWLPKFTTSLWGMVASKESIPKALQILGQMFLLLSINPCLVIGFQATLCCELPTLFSRKASKSQLECLTQETPWKTPQQPLSA